MSTSPLGNCLVSLTKAERALQAAQTLPEIKWIIDLAAAPREYVKAASLGESVAIAAEKIKLQAQRKASGLLNQLEKGKGGTGRSSPRRISTSAEPMCYWRPSTIAASPRPPP